MKEIKVTKWFVLVLLSVTACRAFTFPTTRTQVRKQHQKPETARFAADNGIESSQDSAKSDALLFQDESSTTPSTNNYAFEQAVSTSDNPALQQQQSRNVIVAIVSVLFAVVTYFWQFSHPKSSIQLLSEMQSTSDSIVSIGNNGKPSLVDFWAPWCENCKLAAPTLQKVEQEYKDKVNFVMVNGDLGSNWFLIERFGVDAIPHLALVDAQGNVQTALVGPIPKSVLEADLNVLLDTTASEKDKQLPYTMLDVFQEHPELRNVRFEEKE